MKKLVEFYNGSFLEVPEIVRKGQSTIRIHDFILDTRPRLYYKITFIGTLLAHDGFPEEHVLGHLEIQKESRICNEANVRYMRVPLSEMLRFANVIKEYVNYKEDAKPDSRETLQGIKKS